MRGEQVRKRIESFAREHLSWSAAIGIFTFSLLMALLMNFSWEELPTDIEVGRIARQDIRADKDYDILDEEATAKLREQALASLQPIFDWDSNLGKAMIIENREILLPWKEKGILVQQVRRPSLPRTLLKDLNKILTPDEARLNIGRSSERQSIRATLFFNDHETHLQEEKTLAEIKPIVIHVQAGESVIRSGDHFEPWHVKVVSGIRKEKAKFFGRTRLLGTFGFVTLFLSLFIFSLKKGFRRIRVYGRDFLFVGSLLLTLMALERIILFVGGAIQGLLPMEIPLSAFYGLIPIAAGPMMVRLILPLPMAICLAPVSAALAGVILQGNLNYALFYLAGSIFSIQLMSHVRSRGQILKVGFELGLFQALMLLCLDLTNVGSVTGMVSIQESAIRAFFGFLGGPINASMVLLLMPAFESVFNYLTPIKLLEYGSLNHPILREMIVRAPGTYHHSHMVGTLAEAASEAIGGDSLFARVASYFHDIGKMKKSPYFIENQPIGEDRHGALSPSMSALIISSHVKDGIDLAREYKLPEKIIDIIPQHQGTKLISYFYNKAKEAENPTLHVVDERDYRYPGPKPQTREAGIILLADTVEAATRALKDRSPARLEEVVRNMINRNFIDGQLDECELTLKDLHTIAKSFIRILMGIYHQRIEYPPELKKGSESTTFIHGMLTDKYSESKPLGEDSLKEVSADSPKNITRLKVDRTRN